MTKEEAKRFSEVLKAYSEGKGIQCYQNNGTWLTLYGELRFNADSTHYRIKPEPKYRPYKDAEEFLKAQKEHGPYIKSDSGMMCAYYSVRMVHPGSEGITLNMALGSRAEELDYTELLEKYYWQDGTPCRILEE